MQKKHIKWIMWGIVIVYGIFIYPNPERFPVLSGRLVSFLIMMLGVSTFFIKDNNIK